jgi:prenyltransferase beta subunit
MMNVSVRRDHASSVMTRPGAMRPQEAVSLPTMAEEVLQLVAARRQLQAEAEGRGPQGRSKKPRSPCYSCSLPEPQPRHRQRT